MSPPATDVYPDIEQLLVRWLGSAASGVDGYRYCTILPTPITGVIARVERASGANRSLRVDRPIVDLDVYGLDNDGAEQAARDIQQALLSIRNLVTQDGVVMRAQTVIGPRWLPDVNQALFRWGASYELFTHA